MGPVLPKRDESADLSLAGRAYNLAYWYSCREGAGPPMADKRVERTKGYLREALEELLREKPLERITVTEVLARAEVSKNAFYTHYGSLTALVEDCYLHRLVYFCGTHKRRGDYATREKAITETMEQRWVRGGMVDDIERLVKAGAFLSLSCTAAMVGHRIEPEYKAAIEAWHFDPEAGESPTAF